jgi:single-stranded DNA-binding protein
MVMEHLNLLVASGVLERVSMKFREEQGTAVCVGSLRSEEQGANGTVYKTFIPFEAYGKLAEALGERHAGDVVLLTGKMFWRKYHTKAGEEKSGLCLLVHKHTLLIPAQAEVAV